MVYNPIDNGSHKVYKNVECAVIIVGDCLSTPCFPTLLVFSSRPPRWSRTPAPCPAPGLAQPLPPSRSRTPCPDPPPDLNHCQPQHQSRPPVRTPNLVLVMVMALAAMAVMAMAAMAMKVAKSATHPSSRLHTSLPLLPSPNPS